MAAPAKEVARLKRFDLMLEEDVSSYEGEFGELIREAPALYRLMIRLVGDSDLPEKLSPLVIAAVAYFIAPVDVIPEEKFGPVGYVDDVYLCAFVADQVMKAAGKEDILKRNWDGKRPVVPLVNEILNQEKKLIGDKKDHIMEFIGYDQLSGRVQPAGVD
jgi:uncharacterized membrane protein YkvA (DUF1232 family)